MKIIPSYKKINAYIKEFRASLAKRGFSSTVKLAYYQLFKMQAENDIDEFDRKYNVETSEIVRTGSLETDSNNWKFASAYKALPSTFSIGEVISTFEVDIRQYTFIDLGSGKGRALMMASKLPFEKIKGIEFSEKLNNTAKSNLEKFPEDVQRCSDIEILTMDATQYKFPEKRVVLFMFNPFHKPIMQKVLSNIKDRLNESLEHLIIIYYHPQYAYLLEELDLFAFKEDISNRKYHVYEWKSH